MDQLVRHGPSRKTVDGYQCVVKNVCRHKKDEAYAVLISRDANGDLRIASATYCICL